MPNALISAPTASGKTEAALLPALSVIEYLAIARKTPVVSLLYVAPLKALINDQFRRMEDMTQHTGIPVHMWHGDAPAGHKNELKAQHDGILMTTPESLESFLMNRGDWCHKYLKPTIVVIDEFHAFLDNGRGKQLMSLLDRIDASSVASGHLRSRRIGLSATLSELDKVAHVLSPRDPVGVIDASGGAAAEVDCQVRGVPMKEEVRGERIVLRPDYASMAEAVDFEGARGKKVLAFAKSRSAVEDMASEAAEKQKATGRPVIAFPHHGSLSKEIREELEHRLVATDKPTEAFATCTLELGIDIGDIDIVFQADPPNSVSSLRQRAGRSGRRGGSRKLVCLTSVENDEWSLQDKLLTQIAEVELMQAGWFEPPELQSYVSVLVSEILSVVVEFTSAYPEELYELLCVEGAFGSVSEELFGMVIDDMIAHDFLQVTEKGTVVIGGAGEQEINDWHFYATFQTEESYSVVSGVKKIGDITPPATSLSALAQGGTFLLGGRCWKASSIDMGSRRISVVSSGARGEFLVPVSRGGGDVCGEVKKERIRLLAGSKKDIVPDYLDKTALEALESARKAAQERKLLPLGLILYYGGERGSDTDSEARVRFSAGYGYDADVTVRPPIGSAAQNALEAMFMSVGMEPGGLDNIPMWRLVDFAVASCEAVEDFKSRARAEKDAGRGKGSTVGGKTLQETLISKEMIDDLAGKEKYNSKLSSLALEKAYAKEIMDIAGAVRWLKAFLSFTEKQGLAGA